MSMLITTSSNIISQHLEDRDEDSLGCARFSEFLQNFTEHQILWSVWSVDFLAFYIEIAYTDSTFCGA